MSPPLVVESYVLPPGGQSIDIICLELCMGDLSFLPIVYLSNHLFISVWMHEYLFYTFGYNQVLLYFSRPRLLLPL